MEPEQICVGVFESIVNRQSRNHGMAAQEPRTLFEMNRES